MNGSHIHVNVKDLKSAVQWMEGALALKPVFSNERMAVIPLGTFSVIFDQAENDSVITIAFDSQDCQRDYDVIAKRGVAKTIDKPARQPWGVIVAYLQGPGEVTFEIEQVLSES